MIETVIIDSGGANLASLVYALERLGARAHVTSDPQTISAAPRVILPGVGAARDAMARLRAAELDCLLPRLSQPVLGICLGMQLLFARSEEGPAEGLNIFPDTVRRLQSQPGLPVPHMGWNQLRSLSKDPLLDGIEASAYVYFVHSYAVPVTQTTLAAAEYGSSLAAVVRKDNFWGAQFHPERSGKPGARLLENFLRLH